jgi:membrane fusion protein, multidrug efflux system
MLAIALPAQSLRRLPISAVVLVLPLAFLGACKKDGGPPQRPTPTVSVQTATKGPLPYVVEANGQVEPNRTVAVQSLVSGQLTRIAIAEGDEVREGQVLFQIDARPFRAEVERVKATLARDEATLTRARADSARFAALAKDGYVTKQQIDQTFAEVGSLAATVAAGRAQLDRAQIDLENTTIRAPIGGRTGQLLYRAGSLVRATTDQLVTINELRPVLVRFPVPEKDFEELRRRAGVDQKLRVRITPNGGDSTNAIDGALTFVDNQVDRASGSVLLKATAPNQDRALWPGQFVSVALTLSVDPDAVTVPSQAVVTSGSNTFVYTMVDNTARRTPVKVGRQAGLVSKIDSGLVGGEQVIVEGQTRLTDGAKVQLRTAPRGPGGALGDGPAGTAVSESANAANNAANKAASPAANPAKGPANPGASPGVKP